jgi:hypothetical protein
MPGLARSGSSLRLSVLSRESSSVKRQTNAHCAHQIGLARVELVEPLRALLEGKRTLADSERALAQIRRRFLHVVAVG